MKYAWQMLALGLLVTGASAGQEPAPQTSREALQAFNDLIGVWKGTGTPVGTREEQQKGFWIETMNWEWQFQGKGKAKEASIKIDFDKGKHFAAGNLRYVPAKDQYVLSLRTLAKETQEYTGSLKNRVLTLERTVGDDTQRLVFTLLHANRFLYRQEVRTANRPLFTKLYQVGATKEGVPFVGGDGRPECIVSGGLGSIAVSYQGQTYYVCCGGCRTEFNENPEKYIKEYQAKKNKK